jgi:uncharacterized membrane protein (UPF0127 family)
MKIVFHIGIVACLLGACIQDIQGSPGQLSRLGKDSLVLPHGQRIQVYKAQTRSERILGLSHVQPENFGPEQGMFFVYSRSGTRVFCMRHTYMNLDIFFLDESLCVLAVERDMPRQFGPEGTTPPVRTRSVHCRYVLEMRADSALAKKIRPGICLEWKWLNTKF